MRSPTNESTPANSRGEHSGELAAALALRIEASAAAIGSRIAVPWAAAAAPAAEDAPRRCRPEASPPDGLGGESHCFTPVSVLRTWYPRGDPTSSFRTINNNY